MVEENNTLSLLPEKIESQAITDINELFQKGISFYSEAKYNEAVEIFQNIVNKNPNFIEAHINLGNSFYKLNKIEDSIKCWRKALSIEPHNVTCYANIANANYFSANFSEAIMHWHIAITIAPDHLVSLMNLGAAYEKQGNLSYAFKFYEQYLKYAGRSTSYDFKRIHTKVSHCKQVAFHNLKVGIKYQKQNNLRNAAIAYSKSIEIYPNFSKSHFNLGSIYYMAEKYEMAINYWLQALRLEPDHKNTYCNLGIAYDKTKQYSYAISMYKRFLNLINSDSSDYNSVIDRVKNLEKYMTNHPELINNHLSQAEEFYRKRLFDKALWEYENFIYLKPDQSTSYNTKINELRDMVNPERKAAKMAFEIGNSCFEKQKYDKAIQAYKRYLQFDPNGEHAGIANKKILECGKLMGNAVRAFVKSDR